MKKSLFPLCVCLALTACQPNLPAQQTSQENTMPVANETTPTTTSENTAQETYSIPIELAYTDEHDKEYIQNKMLLLSKFYPIGWGKNGAFAYIIEPADEACGCYFFEIHIADKNGQELWSWRYDSGDEPEPMQANLDNTWAKNQDLFTEKLKEYGIVQQTSWTITPTEFDDNGKHLAVSSTIQKGTHDLLGFDDVVKTTEFYLHQNGEKKNIFTQKHEMVILSDELIGVLRHPSEKRAVAVSKVNIHGYEGPPTVLSFYLVGVEWD